MAAGQWSRAAAALASKATPAASRAALDVCCWALAGLGEGAGAGVGLEPGAAEASGAAGAPIPLLLGALGDERASLGPGCGLPVGEVSRLRQLQSQLRAAVVHEAAEEEQKESAHGPRAQYTREQLLGLAPPEEALRQPSLPAALAGGPLAPRAGENEQGQQGNMLRQERCRYSREQLLGLAPPGGALRQLSLPAELAAGPAPRDEGGGQTGQGGMQGQQRRYTRERLLSWWSGMEEPPAALPAELLR
jgi:hypothetical protein